MSEELQQKLRDQLWEVANKLRGNMSASDFMYFTLGFIFYKYLSEKIEKHANDALVDDEVTFKELWAMEKDEDIEELQEVVKTECLENIGYFIEPNFLFSSVIESIKKKENILPMLERSLKRIEDSTLGQDSEEDFGGLFSDIDLASPKLGKTADDKNSLVSNVLLALDDIDFGVEASQEIDILGDAYEYMISQFAAGAGKKAGEFYTPQEVSRILAEIVTIGHARLRNVYDPTCGSGSLLLRAASIGHANEIFGQEKNPTTYNLARMNMFLHNINYDKFNIALGNTLIDPQFGDDKPFDAIVSNPPYSVNWIGSDDPTLINDDRFAPAGVLAPKSKADFAFVLHALYYLSSKGRAAIVCFPGIFYRGGAEQKIRKYLVDGNYVETIISLPSNLFYGTSIAVNILVLSKHKSDTKIQFIDASGESFFTKETNNNILEDRHIDRIIAIFDKKEDVDYIAKSVDYKVIAENDYNLSVSSYIEVEDTRPKTDIKELNERIRRIVARENELRAEIDKIVTELEEDEL